MRRQLPLATVIVTLAVVLTALAVPEDAAAIPAFARRYQLSCSTCHAPVPRLKPYGEEFAARGFRMEDPSQEPPRATYDVGDPLLKLVRDLPLAVRLDLAVTAEDTGKGGRGTDFGQPWMAKLLSGGPITEKISYYFYAVIEDGESLKLEDAFLSFSSPFGLPLSVSFGQFQVSDPLFKRELRLEHNDYAIYKTRVGYAPTDLTYDRGFVVEWDAPGGVEVVGQLVTGTGIDKARYGGFDNGGLENVALHLGREFGPVRVGLFAYRGKAEMHRGGPASTITYFGPDLGIGFGEKWELNLSWLARRDDDPFFTGRRGRKTATDGGFAELHYFPLGQDGRWVLTALYNYIDSDLVEVRRENASLTLTYLLARNLKVLGELYHDFERDDDRLLLGFVTAF